MREEILSLLSEVEREKEVIVLYAVESGSRAWGFASKDSDYDVRFIYIHTVDWYLSLQKRRDVIERPITDDIDLSGWDIRKALLLFRKSNPPLLEWLRTPIVYVDRFGFADRLRELTSTYFSPKSCIYHYLHMAEGNFREYLRSEMVRVKKYFYVLRPILACKWIEERGTPPPMEFKRLVETEISDEELRGEIEELLTRKVEGDELREEPRIDVINEFLGEEIEHYNSYVEKLDKEVVPGFEELNRLFRKMLEEV